MALKSTRLITHHPQDSRKITLLDPLPHQLSNNCHLLLIVTQRHQMLLIFTNGYTAGDYVAKQICLYLFAGLTYLVSIVFLQDFHCLSKPYFL